MRGSADTAPIRIRAVDAIPASAAIVLALQNVVARETDPLASAVVTIGTIEGGYRNNVIADEVKMSGTLRAHDPAVRDGSKARYGASLPASPRPITSRPRYGIVRGYPPVINDAPWRTRLAAYVRAHSALRVERPPPTMGGEDFAYFAQRVPGLLVRLGVRNESSGAIHPAHSPLFRIDEGALPIGIATLVLFARSFARCGMSS